MVAFIPKIDLMVAFISKNAMMATIRFNEVPDLAVAVCDSASSPTCVPNTLGWRARRVVVMAQSRLMDLVGIALLFAGLALFAAVPLLALLRLTGGSVPRRNQRGLSN